MSSVGGLSPEASKMFRVRKTAFKMLSKRGYLIVDEQMNMSTDEFRGKMLVPTKL